MDFIYWGKNCISYKFNYWVFSRGETLILISAWTLECKFTLTLKIPNDLISFTSCIIEGFISILSNSKISFDISVGFTDPYNSLFSVLNFLTKYSFLLIFS